MAVCWLVRLVACLLLWRLALTQQYFADEAAAGARSPDCTGVEEMSRRFCSWQQEVLRHNTSKDYSNCSFVVRDPAFLEIFGLHSQLEVVAEADAHEGGVYNPADDCFYFSTPKQMDPKPNTKIMKVNLQSGNVEVVIPETELANGMVLGKGGQLLVCQQGIKPNGGYIQSINLANLDHSIVADNWQGYTFNSPNDVVVKSDGSIWFTDPDYGWVQGFGKEPEVKNQVYRISPLGLVDVVADGFVKPNGLAFSPDEKLLYVTDTGSTIGDAEGHVEKLYPSAVIVFDVAKNGASLLNRRLFATISTLVGKYKGIGCPDGIKVDTMGNVYVANPDGIQVFDSKGKLLGLINIPSASNMGFAGKELNNLIILNDTTIHKVRLFAHGAGLHYHNHIL